MLPGDVIFETGSDRTSKLVIAAQKAFCKGNGDRSISHTSIVIMPFLVMEADPKKNIHFRIFKYEDIKDILYIYRRTPVMPIESVLAAADTLVSEKYSYKSILLSRILNHNNIDAVLGSSFCSGFVKKFLQLASCNHDLSKNLLLSPCELQDELSYSSHWVVCPKDRYELLWRDEAVASLLRESAMHSADSFKRRTALSVDMATLTVLLADPSLSFFENTYPFDLLRLARNATLVEQLEIVAGMNHWSIKNIIKKIRGLRQRLLTEIIEDVHAVSAGSINKENGVVGAGLIANDLLNHLQAMNDAKYAEQFYTTAKMLKEVSTPIMSLPLEQVKTAYSNAIQYLETLNYKEESSDYASIKNFVCSEISVRCSEIEILSAIRCVVKNVLSCCGIQDEMGSH